MKWTRRIYQDKFGQDNQIYTDIWTDIFYRLALTYVMYLTTYLLSDVRSVSDDIERSTIALSEVADTGLGPSVCILPFVSNPFQIYSTIAFAKTLNASVAFDGETGILSLWQKWYAPWMTYRNSNEGGQLSTL